MIANNWSKVPTTLVEMGYMTNREDDTNMQDPDYQLFGTSVKNELSLVKKAPQEIDECLLQSYSVCLSFLLLFADFLFHLLYSLMITHAT